MFGAFSVLVWGTTFVSTKVLLRAFTPLEIMVARFTLGFLALLIVGKGLMRPQKRWHEGLFALAGLSGVTLYFLMENIALTYISASLVGVIVAAAPLFTALIAAVVLHEKLSKWIAFSALFVRWRVSRSCRSRASVSCISVRLVHCSA